LIKYIPKERVYHPKYPSVDAVSAMKKFLLEANSVDFDFDTERKIKKSLLCSEHC